MPTITIPKSVIGNDELVVMPRKEYEQMKSSLIPTFFLKGRAAKRLDRRVEKSLKEYRAGKTEPMRSFLKREHPRLYKEYGG